MYNQKGLSLVFHICWPLICYVIAKTNNERGRIKFLIAAFTFGEQFGCDGFGFRCLRKIMNWDPTV